MDQSGNNHIIIGDTPLINQDSLPRQDFEPNDFSVLIEQKGYRVLWEKAVVCPCKSKISDNQSRCLNCGGSGWVFIDKIQTRMLMFSMNSQTKYKEWSLEKVGTASISCNERDHISYMDKITQIDSDSVHKQLIYPFLYGDKVFSYLNYNIKEIINCYLYIDYNKKLKPLYIKDGDFIVEDNVFILNNKYYKGEDNLITISLTYRHYNTYHILDITRDVINSFVLNENGKEEPIKLPLSAIARKAQYILDYNKISGVGLLDNSK